MTRARVDGFSSVIGGAEYDADEVEFILAMERYQKARNRRFPSFTEVLAVAKSLGYRKCAPSGDLPAVSKRYPEG